ncbi:MAG: putative acyltransferase [Marmoricola sp.]|nr:putative acyltransferase [Marmoricola sp.]
MTTTPSSPTCAVRADIQGLRAIAVSLVLVYHLAPKSVTGGFAGVDVFFVISGFLITLHLLEHIPTGPRDLVKFWSRRVRRLLPASLLVLSAILIASRLVAPDTQWADTARQARAAALYVVNWLLANNAVDYLAAQNAPSPVQHFWSLSVEEQFYLVWPILILLLAALARLIGRKPLPVVLAGLTVIVGASFAWSVHLTRTNPAAAYFVTPTRVWELGIGGILAAVTLLRPGQLRPAIATPLAWLGLAAIGWTAFTYTGSTPFPGWQAAVPVLGTAAVIGAHARAGRIAPGPLLGLPPIQWLGNISYSVYLWHWPLVVLVPEATGHPLTWTDRGAIVAVTLLLATATKALVEDRFRNASWGIPLPKPFALAAVAMAVVVAGAGIQLAEVDHRVSSARLVLAHALATDDPCFGARALDHPSKCPDVPYNDLVPDPIAAALDRSDDYNKQANGYDCRSYQPSYNEKRCTFGRRHSTVNVVLVGNSHAGEWLPALQQAAKKTPFKITTLIANRCAFSEIRQNLPAAHDSLTCLAWVKRAVTSIIDLHPAMVVMSDRISVTATGYDATGSVPVYGSGYRTVLQALSDAGVKVLVLHDTPAPNTLIPECIAAAGKGYHRCDGTRARWLPPAPEESAVRAVGDPNIRFADLTDHICGPVVCAAVNGGVITYFDASHLSATYSTTLAPYLAAAMAPLMPAGFTP